MNKFIDTAIFEIKNIYAKSFSYLSDCDIKVVWFCKTLQNGKALIAIVKPGFKDYYEATYDGDKKVIYLDKYTKYNQVIIDCSNIEENLFE
jgi:hypothetical protein